MEPLKRLPKMVETRSMTQPCVNKKTGSDTWFNLTLERRAAKVEETAATSLQMLRHQVESQGAGMESSSVEETSPVTAFSILNEEEAIVSFAIPKEEQEAFRRGVSGGFVFQVFQSTNYDELDQQIASLFACATSLKGSNIDVCHFFRLKKMIRNFVIKLVRELQPEPLYLALVDEEIRFISTLEGYKNNYRFSLEEYRNFLLSLPVAFHLANKEKIEACEELSNCRTLKFLWNESVVADYTYRSFCMVPESLYIIEDSIGSIDILSDVPQDDVDQWRDAIGETTKAIKIPSKRVLDDSRAIDIAMSLVDNSRFGKQCEEDGLEIPAYTQLCGNLAERLIAIKNGVGDQPLYISIFENEIRITTTKRGRINAGLLLETDQEEARRFINEMPKEYAHETRHTIGWITNDKYCYNCVNIDFKLSQIEAINSPKRTKRARQFLEIPSTGELFELPQGYTIEQIEKGKKSAPLGCEKKRVKNCVQLPSLKAIGVDSLKTLRHSSLRANAEPTFLSAFGKVYDLRKWDKGLFLLRLAAWVGTVALAFIPIVSLFVVCEVVDCLKKRKKIELIAEKEIFTHHVAKSLARNSRLQKR